MDLEPEHRTTDPGRATEIDIDRSMDITPEEKDTAEVDSDRGMDISPEEKSHKQNNNQDSKMDMDIKPEHRTRPRPCHRN